MRTRLVGLLVAAVLATGACGGGSKPAPVTSGSVVKSSASKLAAAIRAKRPKPVVVNYWATWCDPCKKEMPRIVDAAARYKGKVEFIGVDVEDDLASAARFAKEYRVPFRSYALSKAEVQSEQDILGLPVTQFYGADGELALVHQGEISARDLNEKIEEILRTSRTAESPPPD